jgi:para-aminobenzoate synthetase component 1
MVQPLAAVSLLESSPGRLTASLPHVAELAPAPDPWVVARLLAHLPHLLFLDSALPHPTLGRYSFITADPFEWIRSRGERLVASGSSSPVDDTDPFRFLADRLTRWRSEPVAGLPPFQAGAAGLFGYDLCHHVERLPRPRFDDFQVPDLAVGFYDWVITFDHEEKRAWLVSTGFPETEPWRRRRRAARRLREIKETVAGGAWRVKCKSTAGGACPRSSPASVHPSAAWPVPRLPQLLSSFSPDSYLGAVRRIIEYIQAGDCFQVNLAQRLLHPAGVPPLELYGRLRQRNAATFAGYFDLGDYIVASASPERFLRVHNGEVETRPIKGTRPRGRTSDKDRARAEELLASAKDRAENVMIVDLLRNDLGRVCRYGSVRVPAVCRLESYAFVHHLVSEVRGRLREGLTPVDLLRAAIPGGSVTGAPKIRAMEIIAELEPTARGPYCGSLGYIGFDGSMDINILIRTFTVGRGWIQFPVGGGIVADSVPEHEYEETWHKADGLLQALHETVPNP